MVLQLDPPLEVPNLESRDFGSANVGPKVSWRIFLPTSAVDLAHDARREREGSTMTIFGPLLDQTTLARSRSANFWPALHHFWPRPLFFIKLFCDQPQNTLANGACSSEFVAHVLFFGPWTSLRPTPLQDPPTPRPPCVVWCVVVVALRCVVQTCTFQGPAFKNTTKIQRKDHQESEERKN